MTGEAVNDVKKIYIIKEMTGEAVNNVKKNLYYQRNDGRSRE